VICSKASPARVKITQKLKKTMQPSNPPRWPSVYKSLSKSDSAVSDATKMPFIHTTVNINAPPSVVRKIFFDFPSYSEWNPFITSLQCSEPSASPGSRLKVGTVAGKFESTILGNKPDTFNWVGMLGAEWIFRGRHQFNFEPLGDIGENGETKGCKFIQDEEFSGILAPLLMLIIGTKTEKGFKEMNSALKVKAEAEASAI
jgi:hypothetical protein